MSLSGSNDEFYMNLAIQTAWQSQGIALPNPAVGALILDNYGAILSIESHKSYGDSHAEILAYKKAYLCLKPNEALQNLDNPFEIYDFLTKHHNGIFHNTTLFVTLEPCSHIGKTPSCAEFLSIIKPKRVVISTLDTNPQASGGINILKKNGIEVTTNILEQKGRDLLFPFLCLQQKQSFIVYKIAQRLNGSFEGGIISNITSRTYSHRLRNRAENLIISQRSVLNDNPYLDARLCNGKAPNVIVLGKNNRLSHNLNIFKAPNRSVRFSDETSLTLKGFNIIEGGAECFDILAPKIDCLLVFISPQMQQGKNFYSQFDGRILHSLEINGDVLLWIQKL